MYEVADHDGARTLCWTHYETWRDGPREGPATVVEVEASECAACAAKKASAKVPALRKPRP